MSRTVWWLVGFGAFEAVAALLKWSPWGVAYPARLSDTAGLLTVTALCWLFAWGMYTRRIEE